MVNSNLLLLVLGDILGDNRSSKLVYWRKGEAYQHLSGQILSKPPVGLDLGYRDPLRRVAHKHEPDKLFAVVRNLQAAGECVASSPDIARGLREVLRLPRVGEWVPANEHDVQMHSA